MKHYVLSITFFITAIIFFSSCRMNVLKGEGNKTTATPAVAPFTGVDIDISLKTIVNVKEGAQYAVQLSGYENLLKHIKVTVENNTLHVYSDLDETWTMECDDVTAEITLPAISRLKLSGAPDADVHGNVTGSSFRLDISGASTVMVDNVNVDDFYIDVSGSGDVTVKGGTVRRAEYEINGSGDVKAYPLQTTETVTTISGSGTSQVTAAQKLDVNISGSGSIKYKGHPAISQDISGSGTISDAN